jgi:hypothetical protein
VNFGKIQRKHPDFLKQHDIEGLVDLIILKAMDGEGNKAFDIGDKPVLMRQPVPLYQERRGQLMGDMWSVDDVKKD